MEVPPWKTVHCPTSVRFSSIRKELFCCRARFYVVYVLEAQELIWISQSMKALADHISESQRYGKFHVSCAYRFIRGQYSRKRYGQHGEATRDSRAAQRGDRALRAAGRGRRG